MKTLRHAAFALVLVLMLVALMAILVVAIFSSVQTETASSGSSTSAYYARQLADLAIQTAKSQIQNATTQGGTIAWASQPGMIRNYDNTGKEVKWFKLYSAEQMTEEISDSTDRNGLQQTDLPSATWQTQGAANQGIFTDINSPVRTETGFLAYPIVDPSGSKSAAVSPADRIAGFDLDLSKVPGYVESSSASSINNPAAMPVRWLYVLEDGTLSPGLPGSKIGEVRVFGAHRSNRVVGRIAFWTDDETCKLNINTAGDGTYFDSPRFDSKWPVKNATDERQRLADRQFAITPPVAREYQRYIGHPAQTRLSFALPEVAKLTSSLERSKILTSISPFLQWGGSAGGSKTLWDLANVYQLNPPQRATTYANVDEWIFSTSMTSGSRAENSVASAPLILGQQLERLHFFVTAKSDAPEVNLFGKPRIAMWPIDDSFITNNTSDRTTSLDRMIAADSSLRCTPGLTLANADTYFFTRKDSTSPTVDYESIGRNKELIQYLRKLTETDIPGFGAKFATKYTRSGADQILTEIFDYIRSTNASDPMLMAPENSVTDRTYSKFVTEDSIASFNAPGNPPKKKDMGRGQVTPIYLAEYGTKGFGRFYTLSEVAVNFGWSNYLYNENPDKTKGDPKSDTWEIAPVIYFGLFSPSLGPPNLEPNLRVQVEGLENMSVTIGTGSAQKMFGPPNEKFSNRSVYSSRTKSIRWHGGDFYPFLWGGAVGPRPLYVGKGANYSFYGRKIQVAMGDVLSFSGATLKVKLFYDDQNPSTGTEGLPGKAEFLAQELTIKMPPFQNLPGPMNRRTKEVAQPSPAPTKVIPDAADQDYLATRIDSGYYGPPLSYERRPVAVNSSSITDTTRSVVGAYNGDLRLLAAQRVAPEEAFDKHSGFDSAQQTVHSLRDPFPSGGNHEGFKVNQGFASTGKLIQTEPGKDYEGSWRPVVGLINSGTNGPEQTGDWDNGPSIFPDGPYINKPDEVGLQYYTYGSANPSNYSYYSQGDMDSVAFARGYSSPNRTIASPVMFGSLPTGVPTITSPAVPWRTLLFRPQENHFGRTAPKDSLFLDLFWMPVAEPYSISTELATAGKVNLNYQIAPFGYIKRATALIGTLSSEYVLAVPTGDANVYKNQIAAGTDRIYRFPIKSLEDDGITAGESTGTLRQFREKFNGGEIFKSASEICDIYLVPGATGTKTAKSWSSNADAESFWSQNKLTGDNSRERPYNGLYSRLTTKSNTFSVYVRTQALAPGNTSDGIYRDTPAGIQSEYRGSVILNRYLDPSSDEIPDFADPATMASPDFVNLTLDKYYKYRIVSTRQFLP